MQANGGDYEPNYECGNDNKGIIESAVDGVYSAGAHALISVMRGHSLGESVGMGSDDDSFGQKHSELGQPVAVEVFCGCAASSAELQKVGCRLVPVDIAKGLVKSRGSTGVRI